MPTNQITEVLTSIWQELLGRPQLTPHDDFFSLGADPRAANRLFLEITKCLGIELSPLTIYQASTIDALARVIEDGALPTFGASVRLRDGVEGSPIFLVPGLCSSVMEFFRLARELKSNRAIYGMHPRGIDGVALPYKSVDELACYYLDGVRSVQQTGPYYLLGYSFGGLVALEIARRLVRDNETIALLALVESYPHRQHIPLGQQVRVFGRRSIGRVTTALRKRGILSSDNPLGQMPDLPVYGNKLGPIMTRFCHTSFEAFESFSPSSYNGRVDFVKAVRPATDIPNDPIAVWRHLVTELVVENSPGGHWDVVTRSANHLASIIDRRLK